MENATKALIMAGSILIAILIITAAVLVYRNMSNYQNQNQAEKEQQELANFNKGFASFEKKLYGSELMSLANKISDYNTKVENGDYKHDGYNKISLVIDGKNNGIETYSNMQQEANMIKDNSKLSDSELQQCVSMLSGGKSLDEIKEKLSKTKLNITEEQVKTYGTYIEEKRKTFKFIQSEYDSNGRIIKMEYKQVKANK